MGGPRQSFLPQGPGEAFNARLLILLIGMGYPMLCAILVDQLSKHTFEFWPTIGLHDLYGAGKTAGHGRAKKHGPVLTRQSGLQDYLRFLRIDIYPGEGKHLAKDHCIHLNNRARCRSDWNEATWLIGLSSRPEDIPFGQDFINLGHREMNPLFTDQEVLNFVPATVVLAGANGPDEALNRPGTCQSRMPTFHSYRN